MTEEQRKQIANTLIDFARAIRRDEVDVFIASITPSEPKDDDPDVIDRANLVATLKAVLAI